MHPTYIALRVKRFETVCLRTGNIRTEGKGQKCYILSTVPNILITIITAEAYSVHDQLMQ
jgi:hypothetical protein